MNWDDIESTWKRQAPPVGANADPTVLRETFENKSRKLSRSLFRRDFREAAVGLIVSCFLAYVGWHRGQAYWPFAVAVVLILGVTLFFIFERVRVRRLRLAPNAPLIAKLEADLAELRHQRRLLLNVATWYLTPLMSAWAIILVTNLLNNPTAFHAKSHRLFLAGYVVACVLFTWGVRVLNRRRVRKNIVPRINELERMRDDLAP